MWRIFYFLAGAAAALPATSLVAPAYTENVTAAFRVEASTVKLDAPSQSAGSMRDNNGLFYIEGKAGPQSVRFLVDTGASHVVLGHADARKLDAVPVKGDTSMIVTAGGPVAVEWVVIDEIAFDGHRIKNLKAAVPQRDIGLSLLGQNALVQFSSIHIDGDHLTIAR
jgi:aspartyl protease family protein